MDMNLSIGKIRGLQRIADIDGIFTMCALDHRGSLAGMLCHDSAPEACAGDITDFKQELCRLLSPHASAVLLDPIYGAAQCLSRSLLARGTGLLVSLEETGYEGSATARQTRLLQGWNVAKAKLMGADAAKLLVYYRPDQKAVAGQQLELIRRVAGDCRKQDLPCLVECLSYPSGDEVNNPGLFASHKSALVIQSARDITALPIDVLKAEFPADLRSVQDETELLKLCHQLDEAATKPWVILSAGVDYPVFEREVELACRAGASGYLAGRAVWQEAVGITDTGERRRFLKTTAVDRLNKLAAIAHRWATPWYRKLNLKPDDLTSVTQDWYASYGESA
jgi:tagatose 1,6-diphosphate aldolase